MDSARSVGPRPPHQSCRLQCIRTPPSHNARIRGIPLRSWHGTPRTKFPISFPAKLPRAMRVLPAAAPARARRPPPLPQPQREWREEVSGLTRARPFLYLSLKIPPGKPECGPRTIFRAPLSCWQRCDTSLGQQNLPPPQRAMGGERSCQRGLRTAAPLSHPITPAASERPAR